MIQRGLQILNGAQPSLLLCFGMLLLHPYQIFIVLRWAHSQHVLSLNNHAIIRFIKHFEIRVCLVVMFQQALVEFCSVNACFLDKYNIFIQLHQTHNQIVVSLPLRRFS